MLPNILVGITIKINNVCNVTVMKAEMEELINFVTNVMVRNVVVNVLVNGEQ